MSYHKKKLVPGTPDEDWIERNINVNAATARQYASGISRTWNRRLQSILQRYQRSLRETPVVGGATA